MERMHVGFELYQPPRLYFYHEAIVDSSFAVHAGLTVRLRSKPSSKSQPKVCILSPEQSKWRAACLHPDASTMLSEEGNKQPCAVLR